MRGHPHEQASGPRFGYGQRVDGHHRHDRAGSDVVEQKEIPEVYRPISGGSRQVGAQPWLECGSGAVT